MPKQPPNGAAQFRADLPEGVEQESVRTTIVGGRPPGSGQPIGPIPRGIEILLKKAAIDTEFRDILLDDPNQAAATIELELDPVESAMLQTFPKEQLAAIIDQTEIPEPHRRTFLGTAAAAMLAVLAGSQTASAQESQFHRGPIDTSPRGGSRPDIPRPAGIQPDIPVDMPVRPIPPLSRGIQSDIPPRNIPNEVRQLVAVTMRVPLVNVHAATRINLNDRELADFRRAIYRRFDVRMPFQILKTLRTVKLLTDYIVESLEGYEDRPVQPRPPIPAPAGARPG